MAEPKKLIELGDTSPLLTYPKNMAEVGISRSNKLAELGIIGIYDYGPLLIDGVRVLGKGHSSLVLLAKHATLGDVAVKIRRMDSKRDSLAKEGYLMKLDKFGVTPKIYYFDDDLLIMEFLEGTTLSNYLKNTHVIGDLLLKLVRNILHAAYMLDLDLIDHLELSNPYKHIFVLKNFDVKVIDFESAKISENPCNLCRVTSYIVNNFLKMEDLPYIKIALRKYKVGCRDTFHEIVKYLSSILT
ncbi:MAG: hypothetical protein QXO98_05055 [Sulfolobales archaeon]